MTEEARKWAVMCHLSPLVGLLGNGVGFLLGPLAAWLIKRDVDPFVDRQGKEALNFQITMFLALFLCAPLILVVVGIPLMILIGILMIVLPIVAAVRVNRGVDYRYPLTIRFVR